MIDFGAVMLRLYQLPEASKISLQNHAKVIYRKKGQLLMKADRLERSIYFIKKGVVRAYADRPEGQVTFWFGVEGDPVLSMKSYVSGQKSYENIELLEDGEFYELSISKLKSLYHSDINLANWGRKLAEHELVKTEERLIAMQFKSAQERYTDLVAQRPELLLRVQLGHIASYLGMSQVSLSRIRAELK